VVRPQFTGNAAIRSIALTARLDENVRTMTLVFLGSGTSSGVPVVGCHCEVCTSTDPRNARTRPSVLLATANGNILIDSTPELRLQLLRERVETVNALLITHYHADHIFGLDDIRVLNLGLRGPMPVYADRATLRVVKRTFSYAFDRRLDKIPTGGIPRLELHTVDPKRPFTVLGMQCQPIRLLHGRFRVLGFRFGNMAYCTDVNRIPERSMRLLEGLDLLVLDALRDRPHPTHFSLAESLGVVARLRPRRCYFTHIAHELEHAATNARLPTGVELAYDGLRVELI
jgi:phosphoribosyl 1,2-cyclic phosphate phosphodiesterase